MSSPPGHALPLLPRLIGFGARHLLVLQLILLGGVWLLYGTLSLHGHGRDYYARATDFWLEREPERVDTSPGIENVLLPAIGAGVAKAANAAGLTFNETMFAALTAAPYPVFIFGLTQVVRRWSRSGRVMAAATAVALYTTGLVPYMTSWGGYVDGASYLLLLPVLLWPESLAVYVVTFVLQCLNHYLGAVSLVILAFVWHSMRALEMADGRAYWMRTFVPKAILGLAILGAFLWFWHAQFPEAARVRQHIAMEKWSDPAAVVREVLGPFPWTILSALKLTIVPVLALMLAPLRFRALRALTLAAPFAAALVLTFVFVDITRVATMLVLPALIVTIHAAASAETPTDVRRRLRRLLVVSALLNLLVPNYYVNNGDVQVPPPTTIRSAIGWLVGR